MASLTHYHDAQWKSPGVAVISGTFDCNNTSAPSVTTGAGFTVAAPSTGVYTVTLAEKYPALISCVVSLQQAAGGNDDAKLTGHSVASGPTLTIETQSADGTAANLAAGYVHFIALLRNTSVTK